LNITWSGEDEQRRQRQKLQLNAESGATQAVTREQGNGRQEHVQRMNNKDLIYMHMGSKRF
jgi:hypothetical protein